MNTSVSPESIEKNFKNHNIRPTAVRLMIWKEIVKIDFAFALADLEGILPTVDRSTIFRTLSLFVEKELLHPIDDGSGQQKYCICHLSETEPEDEHCEGHRHVECQHVHLSCTVCGKTFCLRSQKIPPIQVPEGFQIIHAQYLIQGICPHCSHKSRELDCCCHNID